MNKFFIPVIIATLLSGIGFYQFRCSSEQPQKNLVFKNHFKKKSVRRRQKKGKRKGKIVIKNYYNRYSDRYKIIDCIIIAVVLDVLYLSYVLSSNENKNERLTKTLDFFYQFPTKFLGDCLKYDNAGVKERLKNGDNHYVRNFLVLGFSKIVAEKIIIPFASVVLKKKKNNRKSYSQRFQKIIRCEFSFCFRQNFSMLRKIVFTSISIFTEFLIIFFALIINLFIVDRVTNLVNECKKSLSDQTPKKETSKNITPINNN